MKAYEATLRVENPLSFRTNEYGNVVRTSRVLHNWALRFALNGIQGNPEKDHLENLAGAPTYSTPAIPIEADFEFQTFHPFPEAPQLLRPIPKNPGTRAAYQGNNTILHYKEIVRVGSTFRFAVASRRPLPREMVITYGGKRTLQRVTFDEADSLSEPERIQGVLEHPINPLDFSEPIVLRHTFQHSIPPSPLFEGAIERPFTGRRIRRGPKAYVVPAEW